MIYLGLDLGQSQDPSALAIVERLKPAHPHRNPPSWQLTYPAKPAKSAIDPEPLIVRHVERMELDTRYSDVAKRVAAVALSPLAQGRKTLVVDATGVGMPVVEMLLALQMGCEIRPVVITGGLGQSNTGPMWHVAKVDLLCGLREAVETGEHHGENDLVHLLFWLRPRFYNAVGTALELNQRPPWQDHQRSLDWRCRTRPLCPAEDPAG